MQAKKLIQLIIGADGFVLEDAFIYTEINEVLIRVHLTKREKCRCGICHRKAKPYDLGHGRRCWRCLDIGATKVYVEAEEPRVYCEAHGVVAAAVPWARHRSRFSIPFEDTVVWSATHTSKSVVSELFRIEWHTVGNICKRAYEELEKKAPCRFDNLVNIGIDETSYKKGYKYMTLVINHDTGGVIWCAEGHDEATLSRFFESLTPEQCASIRCVTADGARWIAACVRKYCPNAERCIDPFHVVSWATEELDRVRRKAFAEARRNAPPEAKPGMGRPKAGEKRGPRNAKVKRERNARFALLKNPENLSKSQKEQLDFLAKADPKLHRAYLLKENLRLVLKAPFEEIEGLLKHWMSWAQRCQIPEFRELRKKIKRHYEAIVATAKHHLSNARVEAVNNKIKLTIRQAYGFRNIENMLAMVMLSCSGVKVLLPGR